MLRSLILHRIGVEERRLGGSLDYVRHLVRTSLRAFLRFARVASLSNYRRALPADAAFVARIVAARAADCGTCVQIEVNLARRQGVPREILQAVLEQRPDDLPGDLQDVYRFAEAVSGARPETEELRDAVRRRHGEEGLVEMGLGMATARFFPLVKRTLGFAVSCREVRVEV